MYEAKIVLDSVSPNGIRLTTMEITYPRFVHNEFLTHRVFSRNSASSRAIPVNKMIESIVTDPVMPVWWGKNQSGMQAREELSDKDKEFAIYDWIASRDFAIKRAKSLQSVSVHKQIINRLLEPWLWITTIVTATEWENFFNLRCHKDAQPELREIAVMMKDAMDKSEPTQRGEYEWHLPYVDGYDLEELKSENNLYDHTIARVSVGRCARVSYLNHDGKRDPIKDIELSKRLDRDGHWSPFEHVAYLLPDEVYSLSNFRFPWYQYRKFLAGESHWSK